MKQGIYEQLINTITRQEISALDPDVYNIGTEKLDAEEARKLLSTYLAAVTRRALKIVREQTEDKTAVLAQIRTCNEIIATLKGTLGEEEYNELQLDEQGEVLTHVYSKLNSIRAVRDTKIVRPDTPISQSSLFTGAKSEPSMLLELQKEIVTADRIDWLVSFIKFSGLRLLLEQLQQFTTGGGKLRIITTTYMEATDLKAITELSKLPNTEIQISYDTKVTRLHAKTYIFHRDTGFTTAYVGSSNLSNPALTSGMEWKLKVTEKDSLDVLRKIEATFESYWNDREFTRYMAEDEGHEAQLKAALNRKKISLTTFTSTSSLMIIKRSAGTAGRRAYAVWTNPQSDRRRHRRWQNSHFCLRLQAIPDKPCGSKVAFCRPSGRNLEAKQGYFPVYPEGYELWGAACRESPSRGVGPLVC